MQLLIATRNKHKLEEIQAIFALPSLDIVTVADYPDLPEVEEDGETFEANAIKKAVTLARLADVWAMADDSGLEVNALNKAPGVYSARYAGEPPDYEANNVKLLRELSGMADRSAQFRCVIALSSPEGEAQTVEGTCRGTITEDCRGTNGFGYDPLFIPEGHRETFAEMSSALKNSMSHRALALQAARKTWGNRLDCGR